MGRVMSGNGWTGGQYSLVRLALGLYLLQHFAFLLPYGPELFSSAGVLPDARTSPLATLFPNVLAWFDAPWVVQALLGAGTVAGVGIALGWHDRPAAVVAWYGLACTFGRNPLIANPSLPYLGWMLLAHACLPPAPYGSRAAIGRADPGGGWRFPAPWFRLAWIALAVGYTYSGITKLASPSWLDGSAMARVLENPLARPGALREALVALPQGWLRAATWGALAAELLFAPLALARRARPFVWTALLAMHLGLMVLIDFADLSAAMVLFHLFTFDPAWIPARPDRAAVRVFYDGACGLCQGSMRFLLAEDRGEALRFAPLGGETFQREIGDAVSDLPDSLVVRLASGELLVRSRAVLALGEGLGGLWRALAIVLRVVPRPLLDRAYDGVATVRRRVFAPPPAACPLGPAHVARRFDP